MELGILAGVGTIGYLLNQRERDDDFEKENDQTLSDYLSDNPKQAAIANIPSIGTDLACADSYPLGNSNYVRHQQMMVSGGGGGENSYKNEYKNSDNVNRQEGFQETFTDFIPANDPTSDMLLDMKERPMADFAHNNMVPFFGGEVMQNMAGTGVESGNYIDSRNTGILGNKVSGVEYVNSGFDDTTPNQTKLSTFTGTSDLYLHKRETGPMFSPAETATGWVHGQPLFRPDMDRYTQSINNIRNDLAPVEPQQVGPGINLDSDIPASGGFHEFTRILPNNVQDYKANQLENRVNAGKYHSSELPTSYPGVGVSSEMNPNQERAPGMVKNKPEKFWDQSRYPTMSTKAGFQGDLEHVRPDFQESFKPNNSLRDQTSVGLGNISYSGQKNKDIPCLDMNVGVGQGPLGSSIPLSGSRSETFMSQDNNIRSLSDCNSEPIGNPSRQEFGQGNMVSNWYVNETDRGTVAPTNILQLNANIQGQGSTFYTYKDLPGVTRSEMQAYSYSGNPDSRTDQGGKFYTFEDLPSTTRAETTEYSHTGNPNGRTDQGTKFWTYKDNVPTTTRETTEFSHSGNPERGGDAMMSRSQFTGYTE
jgi:hypothetical protein